MTYRTVWSNLFIVTLLLYTCLAAGCTEDNPVKNVSPASTNTPPGTTPDPGRGVLQYKGSHGNLTMGEHAELHKGNFSLLFTVQNKQRDPLKQSVLFELSVKNTGDIPFSEQQFPLSELYALDKTGKRYVVPTHLALKGLAPGETRSGTIEVRGVTEQALPGFTFHYRFGEEEASWIIIPENPLSP